LTGRLLPTTRDAVVDFRAAVSATNSKRCPAAVAVSGVLLASYRATYVACLLVAMVAFASSMSTAAELTGSEIAHRR